MDFDPEDAAMTIALLVSGFIMVQIATFSIYGINFGDTVYSTSVAGVTLEVTLAYLMSVAALAGTIATNDNAQLDTLKNDVENLDDYYTYAVVATGALMLAWLFIPQLGDFVRSGDTWGLLYVGVTTTGQFALGWML